MGEPAAGAPVAPVLVAAGGASWEAAVLPLLAAPGAPVRLARRCVDVPDLVAAAAAGRAGLAVVAAGLPGWDADVVARLGECGVRTLVVADGAVETERSRRLGADAVLSLDEAPDPSALLRALQSLGAAGPTAPTGGAEDPAAPAGGLSGAGGTTTRPGAVVAVWGPTGAPGRSTVALGLAAAAAARRIPTVLVDADVYGGATAQMLAVLDEVSGVLAAARAASSGALDPTALAAAARQAAPGLRVVTGLPRADRWTALRPAAVREVLSVARRTSPLVVVDCGFCLEQDEELSFDTAAPRRNGATTTVLEEADTVLAVGSADPLGLARLARARSDLREVVPAAAVRLVVNRVRGGLGWSREEVAATLLQGDRGGAARVPAPRPAGRRQGMGRGPLRPRGRGRLPARPGARRPRRRRRGPARARAGRPGPRPPPPERSRRGRSGRQTLNSRSRPPTV